MEYSYNNKNKLIFSQNYQNHLNNYAKNYIKIKGSILTANLLPFNMLPFNNQASMKLYSWTWTRYQLINY